MESQQVLEWQEAASVQTRRDDVMRLVGMRFGTVDKDELERRIGEIDDFKELGRWLDSVATAASFEDFMEMIDEFRDAVGD